MSATGHVRIGHKAPYFHCDAVIKGAIEEVTLNTYIRPSSKPGETDPHSPWLIILFIPAAFSFVCPTEVLAFQNCHDEFKDRNCSIVFVSVDTKHSLWHWQNVPRQYGGLGQIDIPLLSDANHRIAQDYGVLIEEEGVSLRGMFIIDNEGIVQQITLNNLTVGRSVLEALRLLEAFQAVAKHGVLCPVDWKPSDNATDTISTISNMLTESYDERLANLQKEFGHVPVTDLDAKHSADNSQNRTPNTHRSRSCDNLPDIPEVNTPEASGQLESATEPLHIQEVSCNRPKQNSPAEAKEEPQGKIAVQATLSPESSHSSRSRSRSQSAPPPHTPTPTPARSSTQIPTLSRLSSSPGTARHSRGTQHDQEAHRFSRLFSAQPTRTPSLFQHLNRHASMESASSDSSSGHTTVPPTPPHSTGATTVPPPLTKAMSSPNVKSTPPILIRHNTYESRRGSHVVLEFADPTLSTGGTSVQQSPHLQHTKSTPSIFQNRNSISPSRSNSGVSRTPSPSPLKLGRSTSWAGPANGWNLASPRLPRTPAAGSPNQTRLQATYEALKKMSAGLASPRIGDRSVLAGGGGSKGESAKEQEGRGPGYFDVIVVDTGA